MRWGVGSSVHDSRVVVWEGGYPLEGWGVSGGRWEGSSGSSGNRNGRKDEGGKRGTLNGARCGLAFFDEQDGSVSSGRFRIAAGTYIHTYVQRYATTTAPGERKGSKKASNPANESNKSIDFGYFPFGVMSNGTQKL